MRRYRTLLALLFVPTLVISVYVAVRGLAVSTLAEVKDVPEGSQEIAWIAPATGSDAWERLVAAAKLVQAQWPKYADQGNELEVALDKAFLELTADVPEIVFSFKNNRRARLLIRWYKLSGENDARHWIGKLAGRATPPLALIGGDISDRALTLARVLEEYRDRWSRSPPLFLIITATAERYSPGALQASDVDHSSWPKLMEIYPGRTFRFSFTNTRMVETVLDFVRANPQVSAAKNAEPQTMVGAVAQANALGTLATLNAAGHLQSYFLYTLAWLDDGYSTDLAETYRKVFSDQARSGSNRAVTNFYNDYVLYSAGDYYQPNPREEMAVGLYLANNDRFHDQYQLLVLPTAAQRARRFLRTLCRRAPREVRNAVVLTGDAISFNNVYRDRNVAWNIQDLPVPLVFFSHRNPIDEAAGFGKKEPGRDQPTSTSTQDLLLDADILQALLQACFQADSKLLADTEPVLSRLRQTRWYDGKIAPTLTPDLPDKTSPFFDADGNRHADTGEHVVWLKPAFDGDRNLPEAEITVWWSDRTGPQAVWRRWGQPLKVQYDRPSPEGNNIHGGD